MIVQGLTFDTGMLIALERRRARAWNRYRLARANKVPITVPAVVIGEWWRGRSDHREHIRSGFFVEPVSEALAQRAGEALAAVDGATLVDAIVMASAASRGDVVYTTDYDDLAKLAAHFPSVRVLSL